MRGHLALSSVLLVSLLGCGSPLGLLDTPGAASVRARNAETHVTALKPDAIPAPLREAVLGVVQKAADDSSRKKGLDYFTVHPNPVGLRIGTGPQAAYVLSFLGTSKDRNDINYEARALVAGGKVGLTSNYSGPGTRSAATEHLLPRTASSDGEYQFELLMGLPGNGVTEVYERHMNRLGEHLTQRFQARPFRFDEDGFVFAVHHGDTLAGFLFTHQRNRLILGERKDADVQSVVLLSPEAEFLGGYTLVGFNAKTPDAATPPRYTWETPRGLGLVGIFGDY